MAKNTRELIIRALITLAKKNPQRSSFTMTEIAAEAGISRQAIYQKHFNNFEDIIEYIHEETNQDIFNVFNKFCPDILEDPFRVCSTKKFLPTWVDLCGIQGVNNFPFFVYERKYIIILIKKTSLISLRLWQSLSLRSGFVKIIQFHLKSIERLSFNWLRLLFVTISCPKKRILSSTQDFFIVHL